MVYIKPVSKKTGWKAGETLPAPRCISSGYRHPLSPCWSESPAGNTIWKGDFVVWLSCMCKTFWRKKKKTGERSGRYRQMLQKTILKIHISNYMWSCQGSLIQKASSRFKAGVPQYLNALLFLSSLGRPKFSWHSQLPRPPFHVAMPQASSSARGLVGEPRTWGYGHRGMWRWVGSELVSQTW